MNKPEKKDYLMFLVFSPLCVLAIAGLTYQFLGQIVEPLLQPRRFLDTKLPTFGGSLSLEDCYQALR